MDKQRLILLVFCLLPLAILSAACRQDMHDQPKYKLYRESDFAGYQKDQASTRPIPANTVARGHLNADKVFYTGKGDTGAQGGNAQSTATPSQTSQAQQSTGGATPNAVECKDCTTTFPMKITQEVLDRGQERFNIYCTPCHGRNGVGNGMVVQRGFKQPPSYYEERLMKAPVGYFFSVITEGFGAMPDYAAQISPEDRWAIVAYLRALQSRSVKIDELTPEQKKQLESNNKSEKGEGK